MLKKFFRQNLNFLRHEALITMSDNGSSDNESNDTFECECGQVFNRSNKGAYATHRKSKKHKEQLKAKQQKEKGNPCMQLFDKLKRKQSALSPWECMRCLLCISGQLRARKRMMIEVYLSLVDLVWRVPWS